MEEQLSRDIKNNFLSKSTEELQKIWVRHDEEEWSEKAFEAIKGILHERGDKLPTNKEEFYQKIVVTRSVEELLTIWINNDQKQWSKEAFPIVKKFLIEKGLKSQSLDLVKGKSNQVLKKIWREYDKENFSNDFFMV